MARGWPTQGEVGSNRKILGIGAPRPGAAAGPRHRHSRGLRLLVAGQGTGQPLFWPDSSCGGHREERGCGDELLTRQYEPFDRP